jgi:NADH:ubiquinone oxidoreductase subunit F (NADH-binding)/NADH:ubiquinone oxidoreductase subunit E/NAD-dependent dihydropyrimidine dehydrogenase PreA subunit
MNLSLQVLTTDPQPAGGSSPVAAPRIDLAIVSDLITRIGDKPEHVVPLLQAIQEHFHYLPPQALRHVADTTGITPAALTGVATFFQQFRHQPAGEHLVRVCHGTACHVQGSERIEDSLRRLLNMTPDQETDANGKFTIERVGCVGCCTLAPVVVTDGDTHGRLRTDTVAKVLEIVPKRIELPDDSDAISSADADEEICIGIGSCCAAGGSLRVQDILRREAALLGVAVRVKGVGCVGMCHQTPLVEVRTRDNGGKAILYTRLKDASDEAIRAIVRRHFRPRGLAGWWRKAQQAVVQFAGANGHERAVAPLSEQSPKIDAFLKPQLRIATEYCGRLGPLDLDEYIRHNGFSALNNAGSPDEITSAIVRSGLRGRGGAGFPTGRKWQTVRAAAGDEKYIICNGDEGDPGAFMDRMILESYPYRVLEGMAIAARAIGSRRGFLYIRHEYPLAVKRIRAALDICRQRGVLGELQLEVKEGAGAFVCGEETALIASIEGRRGMPTLRPPFPAERGLWGKPTCINNVETYALVPWIFRHGPDAFAAIGTATSKGTKVFSLTGKVNRAGLIEVPMGTTIRQIVEEIGGGIIQETPAAEMLPGYALPPRTFKAVQIGGPSGGCIPASLADVPVDYESLRDLGAIMGSGGLVVLDNRDCMVDMARYFLQFTQAESCGKCAPCRVGTKRMLEILDRLATGKAKPNELTALEDLAREVKSSSLCGLGQTAPNPVLSTLHYFREEYEAHLQGRCPAGRCTALVKYIVKDGCVGCTRCAQVCPSQAIEFTPYQPHVIDTAKCTHCDACRPVCPTAAIEVHS